MGLQFECTRPERRCEEGRIMSPHVCSGRDKSMCCTNHAISTPKALKMMLAASENEACVKIAPTLCPDPHSTHLERVLNEVPACSADRSRCGIANNYMTKY